MERVLSNLCRNAIDAMSTVVGRPRMLHIDVRSVDGSVLAAVADSGVGVDPDNLERIFDPLFTTKCCGMGLGLSICRAVIEAHGGRLWATPNEPHGTVLQFVVPARR
jgi:signal transduction histidine kinase